MAVAKNTLRILTLERLGETFNQQSCPLRYTPRKFVIHPEHKASHTPSPPPAPTHTMPLGRIHNFAPGRALSSSSCFILT